MKFEEPDKTQSISTVPLLWIVKNKDESICRWPKKYKPSYVEKKTTPQTDWSSYKVQIIGTFGKV